MACWRVPLAMQRLFSQRLKALILVCGLAAGPPARADAISAVQLLREGGCGGLLPPAPPLHRNAFLDRAAEQAASGNTHAAQASGYAAQAAVVIHFTGPEASLVQSIRRSNCRSVMDSSFRDVGLYRHGLDSWLVLASPRVSPSRDQAPVLAMRTLELINAARARGARCGDRAFAPVAPLTMSGTLSNVALGHAADMAQHNYFEHEDLSGHTPADRVRSTGYKEKLVGENIAYGPKSPEEVVQGWLDSTGHCENIMDARFAEMGIAYAPGQVAKHGLYWVQLLAAPRA
jgi:uncharacterized protein YkwD